MSQTPEDKAPAKKPRRWGRVVLVISLTLNLLVVGLIIGTSVQRKAPQREGERVAVELSKIAPLVRALPEASRDELRQTLAQKLPDRRAAHRELRDMFDQMQTALSAVPFDRAAVEAVLDRQDALIKSQADWARSEILDHIETLTDAERAEIAERFKKVLRRGPPKPDGPRQPRN